MNTGTEKTRKALGKGLTSLLPSRGTPQPIPAPAPSTASAPPQTLAIEAINPNPVQPRTVFRPDRLQELAASIQANGIIQPLIVRRVGEAYQIVAGERRWRAAKLAGLKEVPVVLQDVADPQMLELALIENIQREDLNPIETAHAYERLVKEMGFSHDEIGRRTGKDRTSVANTIRLLRLPKEVQLLVAEHRISSGHARAILSLTSPQDQIELAEKTAAQGLSVRQVEAMVQESASDRPRHPGSGPKREAPADPNVRAAADQLERVLGTRVRIVELSEQRGRIEIEYYSKADLDRIYQQVVGES